MTAEKTTETCRCPNRPRFPSWGRDSAAETAAMRRWDYEHGHHAYAKARDMVADVYCMRRRSDGPDPDVAYEGKVFKEGGYQARMSPEATPHMINAVDNILRDCAVYNTPEETARFNALRLEMFRIFPEQKAGYISDPVSAIIAHAYTYAKALAHEQKRAERALDSRLAVDMLAPPPVEVAAVASEMKAAHDANGSPTEQE